MAHEKKTKTYRVAHGMRVSHEKIIDWRRLTIVNHIEMEMPGYELTINGPKMIVPKKQELANDEE